MNQSDSAASLIVQVSEVTDDPQNIPGVDSLLPPCGHVMNTQCARLCLHSGSEVCFVLLLTHENAYQIALDMKTL